MNNLLAFNVSQEVDESEIVNLSGTYDPEQQMWIGGTQTSLGCCGSYTATHSCTRRVCRVDWWFQEVCDCIEVETKSDYADCE